MSGLKPAGPLDLQGNIADNFKDWVRQFEIYAVASGIDDGKRKCNLFLHVAGPGPNVFMKP